MGICSQAQSEVFDWFLKWKALVENFCSKRLKVFRTDGDGEYVSTKFEEYLELQLAEICHEHTIPKTPEQNAVAERMKRTVVETVHSMLIDTKLSHRYPSRIPISNKSS